MSQCVVPRSLFVLQVVDIPSSNVNKTTTIFTATRDLWTSIPIQQEIPLENRRCPVSRGSNNQIFEGPPKIHVETCQLSRFSTFGEENLYLWMKIFNHRLVFRNCLSITMESDRREGCFGFCVVQNFFWVGWSFPGAHKNARNATCREYYSAPTASEYSGCREVKSYQLWS